MIVFGHIKLCDLKSITDTLIYFDLCILFIIFSIRSNLRQVIPESIDDFWDDWTEIATNDDLEVMPPSSL